MMHKTTMRLWYSTLLVIGLVVLVPAQAGSLEPPPGPVSPTRPPDTCYDDTGNRFVDCGDGTIKDTETGLYWLKDAVCSIGGMPLPPGHSIGIEVSQCRQKYPLISAIRRCCRKKYCAIGFRN